jgi:transcription initiation factor IIF auxiliary subunit
MSTPFIIQQWENYEGDDWWDWAVWLEGPPQELDNVESVEWKLHPTFPTPIRRTMDRSNNFRIETAGWGAFPIRATVTMKDQQQYTLTHKLKLHYEDGTETTK